MESIGLLGIAAPVDGLVNLPELRYTKCFGNQGKRAIIGRNNKLPGFSFQRYRFPFRTYPRINYRNEYRSCRIIRHRLDQSVSGFPNVVSRNFVCKIKYLKLG
ncbi:hypothetical protein D3C86_1453110 [compost metagenome]